MSDDEKDGLTAVLLSGLAVVAILVAFMALGRSDAETKLSQGCIQLRLMIPKGSVVLDGKRYISARGANEPGRAYWYCEPSTPKSE